MKLSVAGADDPWSLPDEQCPDVYFTAGYGIAAAANRGGSWRSAHWEDRILLPYIVSDGDAASPYGYSGIHVGGDCTAADLARFWHLAGEIWREQGVVSLFLRFSPLDEPSALSAAGLEDLTVIRRGETVTVPVEHGADRVWTAMEGRSRTAVRKAEAAGLTAGIRPARPDDLRDGAPFRRVYADTMRRVGSRPGYLFPDAYYVALLDGLGEGLWIAQVNRPDGAVLAASLVLVHRDRVHYHLSGSTPAGAASGANNLLVWTILRWAADHDRSVVHLGGGLAGDDGLFRFKRSFGGRVTPFRTGSAILDPPAYRRLVEHRARELGCTPRHLDENGFFPAYRWGTGAV